MHTEKHELATQSFGAALTFLRAALSGRVLFQHPGIAEPTELTLHNFSDEKDPAFDVLRFTDDDGDVCVLSFKEVALALHNDLASEATLFFEAEGPDEVHEAFVEAAAPLGGFDIAKGSDDEAEMLILVDKLMAFLDERQVPFFIHICRGLEMTDGGFGVPDREHAARYVRNYTPSGRWSPRIKELSEVGRKSGRSMPDGMEELIRALAG